jgi:hypothetical protein
MSTIIIVSTYEDFSLPARWMNLAIIRTGRLKSIELKVSFRSFIFVF